MTVSTSVKQQTLWTVAQDDQLKSLYDEGYSSSQIGGFMGKTRNSIIGRVHRLHLNLRGAGKHPPKEAKRARSGRAVKPRGTRSNVIQFRPRPKQEQIEIRCAEIEPRHVSLAELESGDCRYAYGDNPFTFCGHAKMRDPINANKDLSYCPAHYDLCRRQEQPASLIKSLEKHAVFIAEATA